MGNEFEFIVVGLGALGSGAAYWLAKRAGSEVLGLEQFEIGHDRGASQDHSRIVRLSYHSPAYVELAKAAFDAWSTLEAEAGRKLIVTTGGLDLWPENAAIPMDHYVNSLRACGVDHEVLGATEIMERWPQFALTDDIVGLFQTSGGIAAATKCNAAHLELAHDNGATLRDRTKVTGIREVGGEVEVIAEGQSYRCRKLVVAADAWTNEVLSSLSVSLPLTVTQEQVTYFQASRLETFLPERFPIWIWMDEPSFYGFPVFGEAAAKVAQDVGGREVTAETRDFDTDEAALERVERFLKRYLPGAHGPILYTKTCLYTMPPDRDFILDTVPGHDNVMVAQGAAHSFKYASVIGKIMSELAIDGTTGHDISSFGMDRETLAMARPPKRFMH